MTKRNLRTTLVGALLASVAVAASCSFPEYNITLPTDTGAGTGGGTGGAGGSSASAGGGGSSSTTSTSTSTAASSSAMSSSSVGGGDGGPCTVDEDGDGVISWECGGLDCADQDKRAHPGADFLPGPAIKGTLSPGTLPFDFNCDTKETKETPAPVCPGACLAPGDLVFKTAVACGAPGDLGRCTGTVFCAWLSDNSSTTQRCK